MRLKSVFPLKKFGNPILKQYLCTTRTRQASPRCSNVRVVLFLYDEQQNPIPETIRPMLPKSAICPQTLIIKPPVRSGEMLIGGGNS